MLAVARIIYPLRGCHLFADANVICSLTLAESATRSKGAKPYDMSKANLLTTPDGMSEMNLLTIPDGELCEPPDTERSEALFASNSEHLTASATSVLTLSGSEANDANAVSL